MDVVVHQAEAETQPAAPTHLLPEHSEVRAAIKVIEVDGLTAVAACKHMEDPALAVPVPRLARHVEEERRRSSSP